MLVHRPFHLVCGGVDVCQIINNYLVGGRAEEEQRYMHVKIYWLYRRNKAGHTLSASEERTDILSQMGYTDQFCKGDRIL